MNEVKIIPQCGRDFFARRSLLEKVSPHFILDPALTHRAPLVGYASSQRVVARKSVLTNLIFGINRSYFSFILKSFEFKSVISLLFWRLTAFWVRSLQKRRKIWVKIRKSASKANKSTSKNPRNSSGSFLQNQRDVFHGPEIMPKCKYIQFETRKHDIVGYTRKLERYPGGSHHILLISEHTAESWFADYLKIRRCPLSTHSLRAWIQRSDF